MKLVFESSFERACRLPEFPQEQVKREPMLFSASPTFAHLHGGPITKAFVGAVEGLWGTNERFIIDSRTHMLMPGWFPCIPGWHLDDVPRTRPDGQPDHATPAYRAEHLMAVVGDASLPRFAMGRVELEDVPVGEGVVYGKWHPQVEAMIAAGQLTEAEAPAGAVLRFDWQAFHRGAPATKNGWRFFIRATRRTNREFLNEKRKQVQVYLPTPEAGW